MSPVKAAVRRRSIRTALCLLFALVALVVASVHVGRVVELAGGSRMGHDAEAVDPRRARLSFTASCAALVMLMFAAGAFQSSRSAARRSKESPAGDDSPMKVGSRALGERRLVECGAASQWQRLQHATSDMPIAISYFDVSETCLFANEAAKRLFGLSPTDETHISLRSALGADEYDKYRHHWRAARTGTRVAYEMPHRTMHLIPDFDDSGAVQGFCVRAVDVTGIEEAQRARSEGERHLKSITDNMPALITYVDTDRVVTFANATFKTWLGADPAVMVGRPLVDVIGEAMYTQRLEYLARGFAGEQFSFELPVKTQGGERDFKTTYIPDFRPDGSVAGIFVLVTDVTAMRAVERRLHQLARIDTLTQLPNRRQFEEKLTEALGRARRYDRDMAMMFLDIDHFKVINDTHGHGAGDAVLVEFAKRLGACVRETDAVARLGGDEFVVLIEGLNDPSEATLVAEKIRAKLQAPMSIEGHQLIVTSSIGIALVDEGDETPAAVTAKADEALYSAKRTGRNRYFVSGKADAMPESRCVDSLNSRDEY